MDSLIVRLKFYYDYATTSPAFEIRNDTGTGNPGSGVIGVFIPPPKISNDPETYTYFAPPNFVLQPSTTYWLLGDPEFPVHWCGNESSPTPTGIATATGSRYNLFGPWHDWDYSNGFQINVSSLDCSDSPVTAEQLRPYLKWHNDQAPNTPEDEDFRKVEKLRSLINISVENRWDPRFILAIAGRETTYGRAGFPEALQNHNFWGVGCEPEHGERCEKYDSFELAVRDVAERLKNGPYTGKTKLEEIGLIYACGETPSEDCLNNNFYPHYKTNPVTGKPEFDPGWRDTVRGVMKSLGYSADGSSEVTCDAGATHPFQKAWGVNAHSPVTLYVTDPVGRSFGMPCFGPPTQDEIPNVEAAKDGDQLKGFWISGFVEGAYNLYLCGTGDGHYELDFIFSGQSGLASETTIEGDITANETQLFVINFSTGTSGETLVAVTRPPVCNAGGPYSAECGGALTSVVVDGNGSSDPNGSQLTYLWSSDCPAATFDDPTSPTPTLTFDSNQVPESCNVTLTVQNTFGLSSTCNTTVTPRDTVPPTIGSVTATPSVLWPPNNKLVDVTINYDVIDNCDSASAITCALSVTSNESVKGCKRERGEGKDRERREKDDDDKAFDWVVLDSHHVRLRAEKSDHGNGRVYWVTVTCTDSSGNSSANVVAVEVPKSQGKNH